MFYAVTRLPKASVGNEVLSRGQSATQFPNECSQKTRNLRKSFEKVGYRIFWSLVAICTELEAQSDKIRLNFIVL